MRKGRILYQEALYPYPRRKDVTDCCDCYHAGCRQSQGPHSGRSSLLSGYPFPIYATMGPMSQLINGPGEPTCMLAQYRPYPQSRRLTASASVLAILETYGSLAPSSSLPVRIHRGLHDPLGFTSGFHRPMIRRVRLHPSTLHVPAL
jgi:hypothetical protein